MPPASGRKAGQSARDCVDERKVSEGDASAPLAPQLEEKVAQLEAALSQEKKENARLQKAIEEHSDIEAELEMYRKSGLSRFTITTDRWHEENPKAAKDMFGFKCWAETKQYIDALHQVTPPVKQTNKRTRGDKMTDFESCLLTKMVFNRA